MATRTPGRVNWCNGVSPGQRWRGLPLRPAAAGEYTNVVKDEAHEAMPASELNQSGEHESTSQEMLRAAFQRKAVRKIGSPARYLRQAARPGQAAPAKFSQQETI